MIRNALAKSMLFALFGAPALAQDYPVKPVRVIVPLPPGSTGEALARLVGDNLAQKMGQPFVIDTRPGASGQIGVASVVRAPADGYTIMVASVGPVTINPAVYGVKLGFDPVKDLAPITQIASTTSVLLVHPSVPARNVKELIGLAKTRPGELVYASAGNTSVTNLDMVLLNSMAGTKMLHVPYKGSTQALIAVASGESQLMITGWINALPMTKAGKVRAIAVVAAKRSPVAPELPAIGEVVRGYDAAQWYGVFAPAGTPGSVITLLHGAITRELKTPDTRAWLAKTGSEPVGNTPEQFGARIRAELAKWTKIVKESGIKPET
jgi:tripartite-type tricarboxylate transporter receptor subunit TctC